ncbi:fimbrial protein [Stenotrophomonas sp. PD6]|uniref:fimbrial protein n=1 Tax=Stenotrophomonas sp. PD6 TaxID=3368612 RepID=UPI003B9FCFC3
MSVNPLRGKRLGRLVAVLSCVALIAGIAPSALAAVTCSGGNRTVQIQVPTSITVPRDAPVGTQLTGWILSPGYSDLFNCTGATTADAVGVRLDSMMTSPTGLTLIDSGSTYKVFETSLPGIGIAAGYLTYANGCGWQASWSPLSINGARACNSPKYTANGAQLRLLFVKTGQIASGVVSGMSLAKAGPYINGALDTSQSVLYSMGPVRIDALACTTPNVTVPLGTHMSTEFKGKGSSTRLVPFKIALMGCPGPTDLGALSRITYQIDAVTPIVDAAQSVVALGAEAGARGIGIQLLDKAGNPFPLGTATPLSGYGGAQGDYSIDFGARYIQTDTAVMPGSADGAMTFTLNYL